MSKVSANLKPFRALAIHATTLTAFLAASSVPTPLYRLYQAEWHFSPLVLTLIFGVYAFALLVALLFAGALSDYVGRRPVIGIALAGEIAAMGLFLAASDPDWLLAARMLQGASTGLAAAALGAALIDLDLERGALINSLFPMLGMAFGALGASVLIQLAPAPLHLVFVVLSVIFVIQAVQTWRTPETVEKRPGALRSLIPSIAVPRNARGALVAVSPLNVSVWALGGFYLSLMPSLIAAVTGVSSSWFGGISVGALTLSGGAGIVLMRRNKPMIALYAGAAALILGIPAILLGANLGSAGILLLGSLIAGIGFGAGFLGVVRCLMPLAAPNERGGFMAAFYIECYLANSLPALIAGYMAQRHGLLEVANLYGSVLILLVLMSLAFIVLQHRRAPAQVATSA